MSSRAIWYKSLDTAQKKKRAECFYSLNSAQNQKKAGRAGWYKIVDPAGKDKIIFQVQANKEARSYSK